MLNKRFRIFEPGLIESTPALFKGKRGVFGKINKPCMRVALNVFYIGGINYCAG